jgi:hypothetical protein
LKLNNIKLIIGTLLSVFLVFITWNIGYSLGCYMLLFPFIGLLIISYSFIEMRIFERECFSNCYFKDDTLLAKFMTSRFFLIIIYIVLSILMTISMMYAVLDFELMFWAYLLVHIVIMVLIYKYFIGKLNKQINAKFVKILSREWTINMSSILLLIIYIYIAMNNYQPSYLTSDLESSIQLATNSIKSQCHIIDFILRLKVELDAWFWWLMVYSTDQMSNGLVKNMIWASFIVMNGLALLGINRFIAQIIYLLDKLFKGNISEKR